MAAAQHSSETDKSRPEFLSTSANEVQDPKDTKSPKSGQMDTKGERRSMTCWVCGEEGHISKNCCKEQSPSTTTVAGMKSPQGNSTSSSSTTVSGSTASGDLKCFYCGMQGHFKRDCPLRQPTVYKHKPQTKQQQEKKVHVPLEEGEAARKTGKYQEDTDTPHKHGSKQGSNQMNTAHTFGRGADRGESRPSGSGQRGRGYHVGRGDYYHHSHQREYRPSGSGQGGRGKAGYHSGRGDYYHHYSHQREYEDLPPLYDQFSSLPSYVDTHCHLEYLLERLRIRKYKELCRRYKYPSNFDGCITSFCDPAGLSSALSHSDQLLMEPKIWGSFGFHPHHAAYLTDGFEDKIITKLKEPKCVAFGEMGLDYSEHSLQQSNKDSQKQTVRRLLMMSPVFEKPIVLHCRDAEDDLLGIMKEVLPPEWKIHLHCFTGSLESAQKFVSSFPNLYIGITGHITYNMSRHTRDVVRTLPLNRILLETDAPYMPPTGVTDRWSHPPMAVYVAEEIAKVRGTNIEEVLSTTRKNTSDIYGI